MQAFYFVPQWLWRYLDWLFYAKFQLANIISTYTRIFHGEKNGPNIAKFDYFHLDENHFGYIACIYI